MKIIDIEIEKIKPSPDNVKKHSARQVQFISEKITKFGFNQPLIVDNEFNLIVGHCRLESAVLAGLDKVPCVVYDNLTDDDKKELMVADNKLNESDWEFQNLMKIDPNILVLSGFTLNEIDKMNKLEFDDDKMDNFTIDKMELLGFEKYDYIVAVFRNETDILNAYQKLGIKKVEYSFSDMKKTGMGRVIDGEALLEKLK